MILKSFHTLLFLVVHTTKAAVPWNDLVSDLSNPDIFQESDVDTWFDQCVRPFADLNLIPTGPDWPVSNYQLFEQSSGLCMDSVSCAYTECNSHYTDTLPYSSMASNYDSGRFPDDAWKSDARLNLPDTVVHPKHVGDVSAAINFATTHKVGVSVKTSGHSYTGSSTKKGTLLLNLSQLQKYSLTGPSITECQVDASIKGASAEACKLAIARNKQAVLRVGGGEIWDEALRAIDGWNSSTKSSREYHVVSGAAGTVSAAGGWLASGGLSANNGMRLYGVGVDQVLHLEMVLPDGRHVRFGPTGWEHDSGTMYPLTTQVNGYCNVGDLSDEDKWVWEACKDEDFFSKLWYAVRGGGGGAYGVVTSVYYQLHDKPGQFQAATFDIPNILAELTADGKDEEATDLKSQWIDFVTRFFFVPSSVDVTTKSSNSCSSPDVGGFKGGLFTCYNGAGDIMAAAWKKFYVGDIDFDQYIGIETRDSYAIFLIEGGKVNPNVPEGRAPDHPSATVGTYFRTSYYDDGTYAPGGYIMVPIDTFVNKREEIVAFLSEYLEAHNSGNMYIMGGSIPSVDDGMNAFPLHRRHGGALLWFSSVAARTKLYRLIHGVEEGEAVTGKSYPGSICHNHAGPDFLRPLKADWTQFCSPLWSEEEKVEKCFSFQEASWGTDILAKLEVIHEEVDPLHLFDCWDCVGYADGKSEKKKDKKKKGKKKRGKKNNKKKGKKV